MAKYNLVIKIKSWLGSKQETKLGLNMSTNMNLSMNTWDRHRRSRWEWAGPEQRQTRRRKHRGGQDRKPKTSTQT